MLRSNPMINPKDGSRFSWITQSFQAKVLKSIWCMVHSPKVTEPLKMDALETCTFLLGRPVFSVGALLFVVFREATWNLFGELTMLTAIRHIGNYFCKKFPWWKFTSFGDVSIKLTLSSPTASPLPRAKGHNQSRWKDVKMSDQLIG